MSRRPLARRSRLVPAALAATLTFAAACGADDGGDAAGTATTGTDPATTVVGTAPVTTVAGGTATAVAPVSSQALLDAVGETVLGQPLAYPVASRPRVSSGIITMQAGAETGLHRHDAPMYAYVLDGEVTVTYDGGTTKTYRAGGAIMEAVGTAHNGRNTGTVPVRILVVNIGADGVADTVRL